MSTSPPLLGNVQVSVVVPTYREAENLKELVTRVSRTLDEVEKSFEIIIVDDNSQDGTAEVIARLQQEGFPVQLMERTDERGLSTAVLHGFHAARGRQLVCMDADLSHPPESLPDLLKPLQENNTEFVVGSRYVPGASTDETWSWFRRLNSKIATWLARPFTRLKDPMAGFFALPRDVFQRGRDWDPIGYKIGLEILVKTQCRRVREIPIHFADRRRGQSKLNWKEQRNYLLHLSRLADYRFPTMWRLIKYCLVGLVGATYDLLTFASLMELGASLPVARGAAILMGMTANFAGNERLTFGTRSAPGTGRRYFRYLLACSLGGSMNFAVTMLLSSWLPSYCNSHLLNAACGILVGTWFNFTLSRRWVFRTA